ncbi:uncharacterized protein KY384_007469 [Bacidia gigantensis]|uniref:uncharacterized protein n=1 Tax=Bacidia gigantensis TaxID=2732470 RepID=UPI001D04A65E|nr:uncharacterized protein KY384_007469 [Bacidia gigantensis]KAG8528551.1 hypothetical protein KY384_007469 [Bacidia gigantensis]
MPSIKFDDSRIKDYPDKRLLDYTRAYFKTFTDPDPEAMRDFQTKDYTMTDIPLCIVNVDRDTWYQGNKAFVSMTAETQVVALSLAGSSAPGSFSIMENAISFRLTADPPPGPDKNLPPGAKAGDMVGMIMLSVLWWNNEGKVNRELEYGRLTWDTFDLSAWDRAKRRGVKGLYRL